MAPSINKPEPSQGYHHRFEPGQKRRRVPSTTVASPQKKSRAPLGELADASANEVRGKVRSPGKFPCEDLRDSIPPFVGVPAWLLEDCLEPTGDPGLSPENDADWELVGTEEPRVCLKNVYIDQENVPDDVHEEVASPDRATGGDGALEDDLVSPENRPGVNADDLHSENATDVSIDEVDAENLATRLQAIPAHTLRSFIYDIAVADESSVLEAKLAEAEANKDVPSAVFGYQYCSVDSFVSYLDPAAYQSPSPHNDEVEYVTHMVEELLLDIAGETFTDSPYATKRAALVVILKVFGAVFGFRGGGNRVAREIPADVEVSWASLFEEVFRTLTTFEKQRLATAKDGVFLEKLDSTVSSIARAGLGCAGRQRGVLAGLTKALVSMSRHGESARRVEELEGAIRMARRGEARLYRE